MGRQRGDDEARLRRDEFIEARTRVDYLVQRALASPDFRRRLKENPEETMVSFGISEGPAEDLARELRVDGDTLRMPGDCMHTCWWTCWWTD
jgi:hypothetical protein